MTEIKKYLFLPFCLLMTAQSGGNCCTARVRKYQLFEANAPNFLPISSRKNCWQIAKSFCMETAWAQVGVKLRTNLFFVHFCFLYTYNTFLRHILFYKKLGSSYVCNLVMPRALCLSRLRCFYFSVLNSIQLLVYQGSNFKWWWWGGGVVISVQL